MGALGKLKTKAKQGKWSWFVGSGSSERSALGGSSVENDSDLEFSELSLG